MKITIRKKLLSSFGVIVVLVIALGAYSLSATTKISDKTDEIVDVWFAGVDLSREIDTAISDYRIKEYGHVTAQTDEEMLQIESDLKTINESINKLMNDYINSSISDKDRELFQQAKAEWEKYLYTSQQVLQLSKANKDEEASSMVSGQSLQQFNNFNKAIHALVQFNKDNTAKARDEIHSIAKQNKLMLYIVISVTALVSGAIAVVISNGISKRVTFIDNIIERTAKYDLSYDEKAGEFLEKIKNKDELGSMGVALASMRKDLRNLINSIKEDSTKVSSNSDSLSSVIGETSQSIEGVAKAVDQLAQGSTELARNVQEGVEQLEELSGEINDIVQSSDLMKEYVNETSIANAEGMENIAQLKAVVKANNEVLGKVASQVDVLDNKSESIGKITDTIKSITDQINLLALNAAIEAARAGEQGRGFAVVADEIRKLAYETSNSTKEIDNIVKEVKNEISTTKSSMSQAGTVLEQTNIVSGNTEKAFSSIDNAITKIIGQIDTLIENIRSMDKHKTKVVSSIADMSAIAEESASTTEEVSASIQQQSAGVEQISQSAEDLKSISKQLQELVAKFRT